MDVKKIKELLDSPEYDFLRTNEHLAGKIGMLCLGGSLAYGTNLEGSGDVDLRGFAFESPKELIGMTKSFQQVVETETDTTIYAFNKLIGLLIENNPNTIELLGCKPEHYFYLSDVGEELIKNRKMFLSHRCIRSFGGYAGQQLARLENAIARDSLTQRRKEEHILISMNNAMASFEERFSDFENGSMHLFTAESKKEGMDSEIHINIDLRNYPVRDLTGIMNEFTNIAKQYNKLNHRNHKKDETHLNKHAMHLLRLYYMVIDILENGDIVTYREKERPFLLEVRQGKFMKEDGTYDSSFYDFRNELEKRFLYAAENTSLPEKADMNRIEDFVYSVNEKVIRGEV